jgi:hypothetical protein
MYRENSANNNIALVKDRVNKAVLMLIGGLTLLYFTKIPTYNLHIEEKGSQEPSIVETGSIHHL